MTFADSVPIDNATLIRYENGPLLYRQAVADLPEFALQAFPIPRTWSILQIVAHVVDSDLIGSHRMKRIIAEENPLLIGYHEQRFAESLFYQEEPLEELLDMLTLNRRQTARILRKLPDNAFARHGVHNEHGLVTLGGMVVEYARHLEHHLEFIRKKKQLLGYNP